ncbi:MAG: cob(I)yrinic acid a,c-diamide adenosyltransferase [Candidatus Dormibacteraeota bacterium]|uniref:Corrinoid adenosyltransferase n=1 Tax=Candidatus Aeolococcus gillhamiae TaxID=3127015 RepID=A0A2W6AB59_9BACT|nr:cob(I)yrinic acid a,c-diamide adenosyltransferase [Candidatus Dormibacteraeota bacterium]PZR82518.1 MAG: cob(I)yrinic acid a,c-diamide adenosyltransferase [Candidatus Dormibacter sp. RRmetagenome_bin12]
MSIVTRHGDGGETSLLYGGRVAKDDLHTEAYGALDEAISALGLARALCSDAARAQRILDLQRELFTAGAELATATADRAKLEKHFATVTPAMIAALDTEIAGLEARVALPKGFVIPGGDPVAAALDLGRSIVRRAERRAVALRRAGGLGNAEVLRYLNRCSDLLFMLAREAEGDELVAK